MLAVSLITLASAASYAGMRGAEMKTTQFLRPPQPTPQERKTTATATLLRHQFVARARYDVVYQRSVVRNLRYSAGGSLPPAFDGPEHGLREVERKKEKTDGRRYMDKPYDVTFNVDLDGAGGDKAGNFTVRAAEEANCRQLLSSLQRGALDTSMF